MMKKTLSLLVWMLVLVGTVSAAFSPPSPFPVVAFVEMGSNKVVNQPVLVEIVDSESGVVYDKSTLLTDGEGRVLFDLGDFKSCAAYVENGNVCYVGRSRFYAGDNLRFSTVYNGFNYEVVRSVEDLKLRVGVDVKSLWVGIVDKVASVQVVEVVKEVVKEVVVEVPVTTEVVKEVTKFVCEDGTEVLTSDECPADWTGNEKLIISLAGLVVVGLGALYLHDKKKYKWAKGMGGILKSNLEKAERLKKEGKVDAAKAVLETARKRATTLLNKYVKKDDKKR